MLMGIKMDMVYVVEPDDGIREAIKTFLESFNVPVQVFSDANEFLSAAGTNPRGCVIAEVELPGLDGLSLLKHLRTRNNDVPFILLVNAITPEYERRVRQDCASTILEKPLTNDDVIMQLQRLFGHDCSGLVVAGSITRSVASPLLRIQSARASLVYRSIKARKRKSALSKLFSRPAKCLFRAERARSQGVVDGAFAEF